MQTPYLSDHSVGLGAHEEEFLGYVGRGLLAHRVCATSPLAGNVHCFSELSQFIFPLALYIPVVPHPDQCWSFISFVFTLFCGNGRNLSFALFNYESKYHHVVFFFNDIRWLLPLTFQTLTHSCISWVSKTVCMYKHTCIYLPTYLDTLLFT